LIELFSVSNKHYHIKYGLRYSLWNEELLGVYVHTVVLEQQTDTESVAGHIGLIC